MGNLKIRAVDISTNENINQILYGRYYKTTNKIIFNIGSSLPFYTGFNILFQGNVCVNSAETTSTKELK